MKLISTNYKTFVKQISISFRIKCSIIYVIVMKERIMKNPNKDVGYENYANIISIPS